MGKVLRVGVVGLGRRWQRCYGPALSALRRFYIVQAVCDAIHTRAQAQARRLHCHATAGPAALLERDDVDLLLLADVQWFKLWPIELACIARKPVFCAVPLEADLAHCRDITQKVQVATVPAMIAMTPRFAPGTAEVRRLLANELGAASLVRAELTGPPATAKRQPTVSNMPTPHPRESLVPMLDWALTLLGGELTRVQTIGLPMGRNWTFTVNGNRAIEITYRAADRASHARFEVFAANGRVSMEWPGLVLWQTRDGRHVHTLPRSPSVYRTMLSAFHRAITFGQKPEPTLAEASRMLDWLYTEAVL